MILLKMRIQRPFFLIKKICTEGWKFYYFLNSKPVFIHIIYFKVRNQILFSSLEKNNFYVTELEVLGTHTFRVAHQILRFLLALRRRPWRPGRARGKKRTNLGVYPYKQNQKYYGVLLLFPNSVKKNLIFSSCQHLTSHSLTIPQLRVFPNYIQFSIKNWNFKKTYEFSGTIFLNFLCLQLFLSRNFHG